MVLGLKAFRGDRTLKRILRLAAAYLKQASARLKGSKEALEEGNCS